MSTNKAKSADTLAGISDAAPALQEAERIGERAAEVGFDWPDLAGVRDKLDEEIGELDEALAGGERKAIEEELGDVLFTLTRLGNKLGIPPEDALKACNARFRGRFKVMEASAAAAGRSLAEMTLAEMDDLWRAAKAELRGSDG